MDAKDAVSRTTYLIIFILYTDCYELWEGNNKSFIKLN